MLRAIIKKKAYRNKIILKDIDIEINKHGLYGFFGKNASGKTTFLKSLCKIVSYEGVVTFNDEKLLSNMVAWVPTEPTLYEYLTIAEFYDFFSFTVKGLHRNCDFLFDIDDSKLLKQCSTGTRKKAYINSVLQFSDYDVYIFDEPFNGLDIESNYILLEKIIKLSETNIVLISSHIIEIIEPYLTEKYFVSDGSIKKVENSSQMKSFFVNE